MDIIVQIVLDWELTEEERNIDVVRDALNIAEDGIKKRGIDDMSFTEFKQWCKRKLIRNYKVVRQLEDQLSSMEEKYARGGEKPDASFFHQHQASSFHKGDAFGVEEPQSCNYDQPEQCTFEYNHHGMEIIPVIEPENCSLDVDFSQLYQILVLENDRYVIVVDINFIIVFSRLYNVNSKF